MEQRLQSRITELEEQLQSTERRKQAVEEQLLMAEKATNEGLKQRVGLKITYLLLVFCAGQEHVNSMCNPIYQHFIEDQPRVISEQQRAIETLKRQERDLAHDLETARAAVSATHTHTSFYFITST